MKFWKYVALLFASLAMVACEESVADGSYTIEVNKSTIEADGADAATFIVKDSTGKNIMEDKDTASKVYFVNAADESRLPRLSTAFTSIKNGNYTFYATVRGTRTSNSVTIKAQNRGVYEKYTQKVCVYQLTGSWCTNCPSMTAGLHALRDGIYGENVIIMANHFNDRFSIEVNGKDLATEICYHFGHDGAVPHAFYDMAFQSRERGESVLNKLIFGQLLNFPAACGVKINSSSVDEGGNITISASVMADRDGNFELGYAILADNQAGNSSEYEAVYNDIVVAASDNYIKMGSGKKSLKAGEEHTATFTTKVSGYKAADLKVVVFAHSDVHGKSFVDNANSCKLGEGVDYILNE